jgi:hypothetical protein
LVEVVLRNLVVRTQATLIRSALIYLLPAGRAIILFGERSGLLASLLVWVHTASTSCLALGSPIWAISELFLLFLAPYAVAVILSLAIVRQERVRQHTQDLYDELRVAHGELEELHQEVRAAAVAEERNRLAREIHDSLAHCLTVANVQFEAAESLALSGRARSRTRASSPAAHAGLPAGRATFSRRLARRYAGGVCIGSRAATPLHGILRLSRNPSTAQRQSGRRKPACARAGAGAVSIGARRFDQDCAALHLTYGVRALARQRISRRTGQYSVIHFGTGTAEHCGTGRLHRHQFIAVDPRASMRPISGRLAMPEPQR